MDLQKIYDDFVALIDSMSVEEMERETERAIDESKDSYLMDNKYLMGDNNMSMRSILKTYFRDWDICEVTTYGTDYGYMIIRNGNTRLAILFNLNGKTHWSYEEVTIRNIQPDD